MSPTSKPSKKSKPVSEWVAPSGLNCGDVATFVRSDIGVSETGRVIEVYRGIGCRIRLVNEHGITIAADHWLIEDKNYIVKERNGDEVY